MLIFFVVAGTIWKNAKLSLEQDEKQLGSSAQVSILMADKLGDIFLGCLGPIIIELIKFSFIFLILFIGFVLKFDLTLGFFLMAVVDINSLQLKELAKSISDATGAKGASLTVKDRDSFITKDIGILRGFKTLNCD